MSDETFRPERRRPTRDLFADKDPGLAWEEPEAPTNVDPVQHSEAVQPATPATPATPPGVEIRGNVPPQFAAMLKGENTRRETSPQRPAPRPQSFGTSASQGANNEHIESLFRRLTAKTHHYDEVLLPSKGRFYNGTDGPTDGIIYIRPMTGEEEQILATPRYVKRGKAIDMIFEDCIQNKITASKLLSVDRTYLLIYLRGISYTPIYEVEVKCPECSHKHPAQINLDELTVEHCPDDFGYDSLEGVLPVSEFKFSYRLACGADDAEISQYRERRSKAWGDQTRDDTLHYRTALLLNEVEGVTDKGQIQQLAKRLPINDVAHIRNLVNNPPFGVDTKIEMICPACFAEYSVELPMETGFFFPSRKTSS
jgi:hypothetical protein